MDSKEQEVVAVAAISDAMVDGLWIVDLQGRTIDVNSAMTKMLGYKNRAELLKKNLADVTTKNNFEIITRLRQESIQGNPSVGEINMLKKNGGKVSISCVVRAMHDVEGKPIGAFAIMHDITSQKQAEESLKMFSKAVENAYDSFLLTDIHGNITYANKSAIKTLGYSAEEIIKLNVTQITANPKSAVNIIKEIKTKGFWRGEVTHIRKNKKTFPCILTTSIFTDDHGNPIGMLGVFRDVTKRRQSEEKLRASENRYRNLFESSLDAVMTLEPPSWRFTSGNRATVEMFKAKNLADFLSYEPWKLSPERQPDGRLSSEKAKEMIEEAMRTGSNVFEWTHKRLNGEEFFAEVALSRIGLGDKAFLHAIVRDITPQKQAEDGLREAEARFRGIVFFSEDAIIVINTEGGIEYMNPAAERAFDCKTKSFIEKYFSEKAMEDGKSTEIDIFRSEKDPGVGEMHVIRTEWLNKKAYLLMIRDITEKKHLLNKLQESEKRLKQLVEQDVLTGLPNRYQFIQILDRNIAYAIRHHTVIAVSLIDIDKFKVVNDTYGHDIGDLLLKEVAERLRVNARKEDFVARIGGDEFIVISTGITNLTGASIIAEKLIKAVKQKFVIDGHEIHTSISVGMAFFPKDGDNRESVFKKADVAMYGAKNTGGNKCQIYADIPCH